MHNYFLVTSITLLLSACNNAGKKIAVPELPYLKADTVNQFKVGDRFILATSTNSCCMYYWENNGTLQLEVPSFSLLKYIETIEDPSDPDCAGCSNFYYRIYECVAPGTDTIRYAVIPMSEVGETTDEEGTSAQLADSSHFRTYPLTVIR